ncbi:MAG: bifunctional transaldolase/phosoglucose isomerase, partial [bacterium]
MSDERNLATRLWRKDASLWCARAREHDAIRARLGWLDCVAWMQSRADELQQWAARTAGSGDFDRVIVLGMGGSSLAPAVFASKFAPTSRGLKLQVLDSTCPDEIARVADGDLRRCLFIVASKSGDTLETLDLHRHFHAQAKTHHCNPESRFVLITDADTPLHRLGRSGRFHRVFINPSDIGGRYSALSYFGLAPAALLGVDVGALLARARAFADTTRDDDPRRNPALALGILLGRAARDGRDKLILDLPEDLAAFGLWVEQLIAESTGKDGKGLVPVIQPRGEGDVARGEDRVVVRVDLARGDGDGDDDDTDCTLRIDDPIQLGAEFFRWEFATAIAASYLRVNPFDQPDVARSKERTRRFIRKREGLIAEVRGDAYDLRYRDRADDASNDAASASASMTANEIIAQFRRALTPDAYLALLAYLPQQPSIIALLQSLRASLPCAVTVGFGPRYLHSTGQLHKGGPRNARFIQFVADADATAATDGLVP